MTLYCPECSSTYDDASMETCPDDGTRLYVMEATDENDQLLGVIIDSRFRVDRKIGFGGMGTVYQGVQLSVQREVAIKVLRTELANREVALERFFREAKVISSLSHPNVVRLIDFGQDRDRNLLFLVMELVEGASLSDIIRKGRVKTALALEICYQVCGALTEPHARDVIHRDLKPDNLLLKPMSDGTVQVKVLDFGIARALESNTQLTAAGMICGTPAYMAPEQAQNHELGPHTDLYSLGVILYELLSGWPPFRGTSSLQVMLKHIQETPPLLRDVLPPTALVPSVEELCTRLLSKKREDRPASAREVRDSIDEIRKELELDPVRIDPDADPDELYDDFLFPGLPKAGEQRSGPTQALQRDAEAERWFTQSDDDRKTNVYEEDVPEFANDTDAGEHHVTYPVTPAERRATDTGSEREDGDSEEKRREKDEESNGGSIAFAATELARSTPGDGPGGGRQTVREESADRPDVSQPARQRGLESEVGEQLRASVNRDSTVKPRHRRDDTAQREAAAGSNRTLFGIAAVLLSLVASGVVVVLVVLQTGSGDAGDTPAAAEPATEERLAEQTEPEAAPVPPIAGPTQEEISSAYSRAEKDVMHAFALAVLDLSAAERKNDAAAAAEARKKPQPSVVGDPSSGKKARPGSKVAEKSPPTSGSKEKESKSTVRTTDDTAKKKDDTESRFEDVFGSGDLTKEN